MNNILKYGLISVGALLVVFLALIALIAATFNPNDYKPLIVKLVQEKKPRTLKFEGDIKLTFFPRISADLGKISLSEHGSDQEFLSADSARVSLAVLPLLKKQLVVDHIRIDGIRARLVRYPDGSTNIDDLLKKEASEQFKFDIEGVSVTHAALAFDDRMGGRKLDISGMEFESGRLANNQPGKIDLKFALQGENPKINAQVALASGLLFDTEAKTITLNDLTAKLMQPKGNLDLAGKIDDSPLKAKLGISHFSAPAYDFDIAIDRLDVDRYLPSGKPEGKVRQPEKPLDFGFLKNLNASGQLSIGVLKVASIKSSNIKLNVNADGGNLNPAAVQ